MIRIRRKGRETFGMQEAPFDLQVVGGLLRDSLSKAGALTLHGPGGNRMEPLGEPMCKRLEAKETCRL